MLQKTRNAFPSNKKTAWRSLTALASCAVLACPSMGSAQENAARAFLNDPVSPLPPADLSGPTGNPVDVESGDQTAVASPLRQTPQGSAGRWSKRTAPGAADPDANSSLSTAERSTALTEMPTDPTRPLSKNDPCGIDAWQQEYACHVDQVLTGCDSRSSRLSLGEWWHMQSELFVRNHDRFHVTVPTERLKTAARAYVADHTLPPEHDYDIDVYDQKPRVVASSWNAQPSSATASPHDAEDASQADAPGNNRLNTDVRKIRPTLDYAMRNIDPEQLPDGFHKKLDQGDYVARQSSPAVLQWAPTNLYHYPLYFEDAPLERYGHTYHPVVQPFASAGRFATQLVGMPYQMTLHPVKSREYALGYYRPGEWAPKKHYQIPFNEEAAIAQAAAMAGFFWIFP